ncbi:conserved hypothetical protein [Theileria equi strain WA]|uniref:Suppressor of Ty 6 homolog n=1 Tax=Theileria equi strain WA TaxID=1537102 RepID=L1LDQ9_THEEQ|nr:conserved hypothetical protein [Theileria equi strain WA]EKX73273.1 conserved hypothetical protein [Theileria equi strain WA]|eukprot:XP_004832725.1 conserved hypothetical protein [Theileria equi strain WA]
MDDIEDKASLEGSSDQESDVQKRKRANSPEPDLPGEDVEEETKNKKQVKLSKSLLAKENYLDTMAEESDDSADDNEESEESEDDELDGGMSSEIPEEMRDFIIDEVEEEEEVNPPDDASDVEYEPNKLDEEDLELIAENTGANWKKDEDDDDYTSKNLRRLKKGARQGKVHSDYDDSWFEEDETASRAFELSDVWATVAECFGEVDLVVQILKNERVVQAAEEAVESDYEIEQEEQQQQPKPEEPTLENYADPDELAREYLTKEDDEIRAVDQPERLFIRYKDRPRSTDHREIQNEATWMTKRLLSEFSADLSKDRIKKAYESVFKDTFPTQEQPPFQDTKEKCEMVLNWLLNERWEVPFILYHKRHLVCPPLTDAIVWRIYQLDSEWVRLSSLSSEIQKNIELIGHEKLPSDVLYYSINFDTIEDLIDVSNHLLFHFHTQLNPPKVATVEPVQKEQEVEEDDFEPTFEVEDDIFGDFEVLEEPTHGSSPKYTPINSPLSPDAVSEVQAALQDFPIHRASPDSPSSEPVSGLDAQDEQEQLDAATPMDIENEEPMEVDEPAPAHDSPVKHSQEDLGLGEMDDAELQDMEYDDDPLYNADAVQSESQGNVVASQFTIQKTTGFRRRDTAIHLIGSCEQYGLHEIWNDYIASADQLYAVLEKSLVHGSSDLRIKMSDVRETWNLLGATGSLETQVAIEGNEEQQIEDICSQYCTGPYTTGKRVYKALVDYHAKKLANHISIRRLLRDYYRNYCSITCTTTPKGEADVDVAESSWFCKRLYRFPFRKLNMHSQMHYDYPRNFKERRDRLRFLEDKREDSKLVELYLHLLNLENDGMIKITIHPLNAAETAPWKDDAFHQRFGEWYERYKQLTYAAKQLVNDTYREQLEHQKSILEREELMLTEAEDKDRHWRRNLLDQLAFAYCPNNISSHSIWKYVHRAILDRLVNVELIPKFRKEIRELLLKKAQASVILHSQRMLQYKLDVAPNFNDTVLALVNDSASDGLRVHACLVNNFGESKASIVLDSLLSLAINTKLSGYTSLPNFQQVMSDVDILTSTIKAHRPSVILVGLTNIYSLDLYSRVEKYLLPKLDTDISLKRASCEVPRLVSTSTRGGDKEDQMALSLARWYIDPLAETLNLWKVYDENVLLRLKLHPLQYMIPQERFQSALESTIVSVVCDAGVDINRVKKCPHTESQLQFIAGLGPRKSLELTRMLKFSTISNRSQIKLSHLQGKDDIIGSVVFLNCASFIKISQSEATDSLDTTRIHPIECGFIAEKLCNGSLDDELSGEEAVQEILANPTKLDELDLEAYSLLLFERQDMPRMLPYLLFIKDELQSPFYDFRLPFTQPSSSETFYEVLQLDRAALRSGSHVLCRFDDLFDKFAKATVLPYQLRAHISDYYQFKTDVHRSSREYNRNINLKGETFSARVVKLDYDPIIENGRSTYRIEISLTAYQRKYILTRFLADLEDEHIDEYLSPLVKFDVNYSKKPLFTEFAEKKKIQYRRAIRHPCYRMWPLHKTVSFLKQAEIPVGECCICPMSEWDRLNLVIKTCVDPFNFATFVIHEKNQRIPGELGKELYIQKEKFNNLDQIIAQFCETLKLNLEEFYTHPKYRQTSDYSKVERDLIQESALKPDSITWAIIPPNPKRKTSSDGVNNPLRFTLMVIPPGFSMISQDFRSLQDPIYVDHKCFRLWTHSEKSLRDLIAWWKEYGYWHRNSERQKYIDEKRRLMDQYARQQHHYNDSHMQF